MASGMVTQIGGSGDTLDRLSSIVQEEQQKAAGRARVARDSMDMTGVHIKEAEQHALAEQALADFAAREGMALEPSIPEAPSVGKPPTPVKSMGPAPEKS